MIDFCSATIENKICIREKDGKKLVFKAFD